MKFKYLFAAAGVVLLLIALLLFVAVKRLRPAEALPTVEGRLRLPHLTAPVSVIRDRQGVPHIYAATPADAVCALGYVHAQDRRLQMELLRRTARGEAALLAGETSVPSDRLMRTLGLARAARAEASALAGEDRVLFESYARCINAASDQADWPGTSLPRMLNVPRDEWTTADTLGILKLITASYSTQYQEELLAAALLREVGAERLAQFMPDVPEEREWPVTNALPAHAAAAVRPSSEPRPAVRRGDELTACPEGLDCAALLAHTDGAGRFGLGSNSWIVHGDRTASGAPYLASDPHMALSAPSGVYAAHLSAPGLELIGVGVPGTPVFLHGHNTRVAWGVTVAGTDTQDLYLEELSAQDPSMVRTASGWAKLRARDEQIQVRGRAAPLTHTIRESAHGPLISDANPTLVDVALPPGVGAEAKPKYALALSVTGLEPSPPGWVFALARARDWQSFRAALRDYSGSGFNFVYADIEGNIGYQLAARIPVREGAPPRTPVPGWEPGREWRGHVPFDSLPSVFNPPDKIIATANARISGRGYPIHLATRWGDLPWRVRRIRELISAKPKVGLDDMAAVQLDVSQQSMVQIVEWTRLAPAADAEVRGFQQSFAGWDMRATTDSVPQTMAEAFHLELLTEAFRPHLSPQLLSAYTANQLFSAPALERAMTDERAALFGPTPEAARARRAEVVRVAIKAAVKRLEQRFGANRSQWAWGKVHTLTFHSPLTQSPNVLTALLMSNYNVGPFEAPGSNTSVNVAYWHPANPFAVVNGAGFRQLIDLGNFDGSRYLPPPPGQSENPASPHYRDLAPAWARGVYYPMRWTRRRVEEDGEATLTLTP